MRPVVLLFLCLLTLPLLAQELSPPKGAQLLGTDSTVSFRWPGKEKDVYFLQIYASGKEMFSGEVRGNRTQVPLRPGLRYQWKVSVKSNGLFRPIVDDASFRLSNDVMLNFDGKPGEAGRDAPNQARREGIGATTPVVNPDLYRPQHGEPGKDGGDAKNLQISLRPTGDYIQLRITGGPANLDYLLLPSSGPVRISAVGGDGGRGGNGRPGTDGYFAYGNGVGGPGGDGGAGGDGGHGGDVIINAQGVDPSQYLIVDNRGGRGGEGGLPGRPGLNADPYFAGYQPPPGNPGVHGQDGRNGRIVAR